MGWRRWTVLAKSGVRVTASKHFKVHMPSADPSLPPCQHPGRCRAPLWVSGKNLGKFRGGCGTEEFAEIVDDCRSGYNSIHSGHFGDAPHAIIGA